MTLLQQQILSQYALMNGLMGQQQQQLQHHQQNQQLQQIQQQHQQQSQAMEPPAKKIKTSRDTSKTWMTRCSLNVHALTAYLQVQAHP